MPSLKAIKKRISSVKNTRQITKAMKMVSAAKLRRAQEAVVAARPYADKVQQVLASLARREDQEAHPLLAQRGKGKALIVLVTSDRGLCGGFNANVSKTVERHVRANPDGYEQIDLLLIGRKGNDYLKRRPGMTIFKVYENFLGTGQVSYAPASLIGKELVELFENAQYDAVFLAYNAFRSAISQEPRIVPLLPVVADGGDEAGDEHLTDYLYEPSASAVLDQLLPKYVEVQIFRAFLESVASEHGARMSAMDSASKNASEMIGKLTLQYNRARQAAITKELMEIISGAEAIK
ncbi:MAG: ATP synthase F1 subunit gamma [Deltaproteobacteria bacterium]|nr:MAG: ATP synthase F1 subunit gamma [Deltaproteobacteria bacterium]